MSKTATSWFATLFVIAVLAFITVLAGRHDAIPDAMTAIVVGAMAGQFATLNLPSFSYMVIAAAALIAVGVLTGLSVAIPQAIYAALSTSILGHFALTLPAPTVAVATVAALPAQPAAVAPAAPVAAAPPAAVVTAPVAPADTGPVPGWGNAVERDQGREVLRTLVEMVPVLRTVGRCLVLIGEALEDKLPELLGEALEDKLPELLGEQARRELEPPRLTRQCPDCGRREWKWPGLGWVHDKNGLPECPPLELEPLPDEAVSKGSE